MAKVTSCPPPDELSNLASGHTPAPDMEPLLDHLETCASCLCTVRSLPPSDTLMADLAKAGTVSEGPDAVLVSGLIERLKRLAPAQPRMVSFQCASCAKQLKAKADLAGKKVKCPQCGKAVPVPGEKPTPNATLSSISADKTQPPMNRSEDATVPPRAGPDKMEHTSPSAVPAAQPLTTGAWTDAGDGDAQDEVKLDFLAPAQAPDEIGRLGTYRILKKLGAGGMGMVLLAEDTALNRKVAIKVMLPQFAANAKARERFLREARAAASIEHEHIVPIFQVGEDNKVPFLAMPFLKGEPLDVCLEREGKLPVAEALRIAREMAEGLAAAHANSLIHRDIKPGNIWLEGPKRKVPLLDFGLARAQNDTTHLTQSGTIVGTPAYMAPEQAKGEKVDGRADLFSLGCVLYVMLTGQRPFKGDDTIALLMSLAVATPQLPTLLNREVPDAVSDLTMRLLSKEAAGRPASAQAVADELTTLSEPNDVTHRMARPATQPQKKRRKRVLVAVGLMLVALLGGSIFYGPMIYRIATNQGELIVEVDDPDIEVVLKQDGAVVRDKSKNREFVLTAREGQIEFVQDDAKLLTKTFELSRGGKTRVKVTAQEIAEAKKPAPPRIDVAVAPSPGASPLVRFDAAKIPLAERFPGQPKELVAILGENRGGHSRRIERVAFHPDGKLAASGSEDSVCLWDTATLRVQHFLPGSVGNGGSVTFSPDGKLLAATSGVSSMLRLWDLSGPVPQPLTAITKEGFEFRLLAFLPDSQRILCGGRNGLELWDVRTKKQVRRFEGHKGAVPSLALSPDGHYALSAEDRDGPTGVLKLWDVDSGKELYEKKGQDDGRHLRFAFTPDGKRFSAGSYRFALQMFEVETGKQLAVFSQCKANTTVFTHDGKRIIFGTRDIAFDRGYLGELDVETGEIRRFETNDERSVSSLALSADGTRLLSNNPNNSARLWDVKTGKEMLPRTGHTGPLVGYGFQADGKKLVSVGTDLSIRVWDLTGPAPREQASKGFSASGNAVASAALSPDGQTLAIGDGKEVQQWNVDGEPNLRTRLRMAPFGGEIVGFAGVGTLAAWKHLPGFNSNLWLWDVRGEEPKIIAAQMKLSEIHAISPDAKTVAVLQQGVKVQLLDLTVTPPTERDVFSSPIRAAAFSPDGKTLATCGPDTSKVSLDPMLTVKLWDLSGDKPVQKAELFGKKWDAPADKRPSLAFSPNGKMVLAHSGDGWNIVWDVATHQQLREWHLPGSGPMFFAPDNQHLVTGMDKGALYVLRLDGLAGATTETKPAPTVEGAWLKQVAALPAEDQVKAVADKLQERNPGCDAKMTLKPQLKIEFGAVTNLDIRQPKLTDLSPLQALPGLKTLYCAPNPGVVGELTDLSPLANMKLTELNFANTKVSDLLPLKGMELTKLICARTPVSDLSPLKDMKLTYLDCLGTKVTDLSPLKGMELTSLGCGGTLVSDLSPLKGMPLTRLNCPSTLVTDLSPLRGMPLTSVDCSRSPVSDLSPLKDMPLTILRCDVTKVIDLSPLKGMPLKELHCDFKAERDAEILRSIKTLETINGKPAAVFWKEVDKK